MKIRLKFIERLQTEELLIQHKLLTDIISLDSLSVKKEIVLFRALMAWITKRRLRYAYNF